MREKPVKAAKRLGAEVFGVKRASFGRIAGALDDGATVGEKRHFMRANLHAKQVIVEANWNGRHCRESVSQRSKVDFRGSTRRARWGGHLNGVASTESSSGGGAHGTEIVE